jgi:MFS transporter, DHA2 family, multidrug resistance protein
MAASAATAEGVPVRAPVNPWLIAVSVMLATFMEVLDTSIAAVALPYIAGSVSATNDEATWVLTSYLVSNAVVLPASSWCALRFGRKRFLITCIVIFTISSFLCGAAPTLGMLLLARAIQGAGGGALQPLSQAILLESFPPEKRGSAMAVFALGVVVAPVLGPTFGGWLTDNYSWRWSFYINIPIGIIAILLQSRVLKDPPYIQNAKPGKLDSLGLGTLAIWVGCLQFILDKGQEDDWFSDTKIRIAFVVMLVSLAGFLIREFTHDKPLIDLTALKNRNLALGCVLVFLLGAVLYALTTVLPVFFQTLLGYDATKAGLVVSPRGLGSMVASIVVGAIVSKVDARKLVALGFLTLGLSSLVLGHVTTDISPWSLFWPITFSGLGLALVFVPLSQVALGTLSKSEVGNASGIFNFLRNIGGSIGISWVNTIAQRHLQTYRSQLVHNYSPANPLFRAKLSALNQQMNMHVGPALAIRRATALADRSFNAQAQIYAYVDDFRYLALLAFLCVPIAFILKRPPKGKQAAAG